MTTTTPAAMPTPPLIRSAASSVADTDGGTTRRSRLLRHYLEMVAAMFVGMAVLGAATRGVVALMGLDLSLSPALLSLEMAVEMSVGMAVWMRHRGHGWASTLEMVGAMFAAPVVLIPLMWLGIVTGDSLLMVEHMAMLPLMYLVMLRRRDEHGAGAHAHA